MRKEPIFQVLEFQSFLDIFEDLVETYKANKRAETTAQSHVKSHDLTCPFWLAARNFIGSKNHQKRAKEAVT